MKTSGPTVRVSYACKQCGVSRLIDVPERTSRQDVGNWMHVMSLLIAVSHNDASPTCQSKCCDITIPLVKHGDVTGFIGEAPRQ